MENPIFDKKLFENAVKMCEYANAKLNGVAKEDYTLCIGIVENDEYNSFIGEFNYIIGEGACVSWRNCRVNSPYIRIFADKITYRQNGCDSTEEVISHNAIEGIIFSKEHRMRIMANKLCSTAIRSIILKWLDVKSQIAQIVEREDKIANFQI